MNFDLLYFYTSSGYIVTNLHSHLDSKISLNFGIQEKAETKKKLKGQRRILNCRLISLLFISFFEGTLEYKLVVILEYPIPFHF